MADPIGRFEAGATKQFTMTYSVAPGITPALAIRVGSIGGSVLANPTPSGSQGTVADSGRIWTAYYTMPTSIAGHTGGRQALFTYTWTASFGVGPVVHRGWFQVIETIPG